jgi:predicted nucleotidyltransferase
VAENEVNHLHGALGRAFADLEALAARTCLVGGLAVSARTDPRFTRDIDLAVAVSGDPQGEALIRDLQGRGYGVLAIVEQEAAKRLATVRLAAPGESPGGVVVDLLFASSGIEPEIVASAEPMEIMAGLTLPVARVGHLVAMKVLARDDRRRPQDAADLRAMLVKATREDLDLARAALLQITRRGFHRGLDLVLALERALLDFREP